jgi:SET domain-containing protein
MFALEPIEKNEVVVIWGGLLFTKEEIRAGKAKRGSISAIDENLYLAEDKDGPSDPADFMNHSCDPNVWMKDEVTLVARCRIEPSEELTADYAMWEAGEDYVMPWKCACGSSLCRKTITGRDWRLRELQERYGNHFSPFINRRIKQLGNNEAASES